jgi:zinc and cadmium transporter
VDRLGWIIGSATVAGIGSAVLAGVLFALSPERRRRAVPWLVAFAAGTLLGAALLELLPEAMEASDPHRVSATLLAGILGFFALERWALGRHHRHDDGDARDAALGPVVLVGDAFHNFVDGVTIAAAFAVSISTGVATAFAILAHEIPQEIGNVAVLLQAGYAPSRAFAYNVAANAVGILGAFLGAVILRPVRSAVPYVLAVACASFVYIAVADLIPDVHRAKGRAGHLRGLALLAGVGAVAVFHLVATEGP